MAKLILKFDDRRLRECALGAQPVTIGRLPDNTLVIDNPAVSGRHACVYREGDHYVLEDLQSTNGTFVNNTPIAHHTLLEGDEVLVGKHSLVFTQAGGEQSPVAEPKPPVPEIGGTMMLDTERQKSLLASLDHDRPPGHEVPKTSIPDPSPPSGVVRVVAGKTSQPSYTLHAVTTIIGRADTAQIRISGWFKPKVAAAIARRGDGFTITPMEAKVSVNRQRLTGRHQLGSGDLIEVAGLTLEFKLD